MAKKRTGPDVGIVENRQEDHRGAERPVVTLGEDTLARADDADRADRLRAAVEDRRRDTALAQDRFFLLEGVAALPNRVEVAAEPGAIDLAMIPCELSTQVTPSVGGPWLCDRCQKLIAPATNRSTAVASSSQVLVVSTELFILLAFRVVNHAHSSHTLRQLS